MALKNVIGIDHAVVMVKDLDKAAENYRQLGFTVLQACRNRLAPAKTFSSEVE